MKKRIIITIIATAALLFWAPWLGLDGGEDVVQNFSQNMTDEQRTKIDSAAKTYACREGFMGNDCCDGLSSNWTPFGRKVGYCQYATWYIPFWGN